MHLSTFNYLIFYLIIDKNKLRFNILNQTHFNPLSNLIKKYLSLNVNNIHLFLFVFELLLWC